MISGSFVLKLSIMTPDEKQLPTLPTMHLRQLPVSDRDAASASTPCLSVHTEPSSAAEPREALTVTTRTQ